MIKLPTPGKHQLENNLFINEKLPQAEGAFQKYEKSVNTYERIHISTLAMDFESNVSKKERDKVEEEWIQNLPFLDNVKHISIRHRVNDNYFEAICKMKNLESLHFWSSTVEDITPLRNLSKLRYLHLNSFSRLVDLSPIKNLKKMDKLSIERCFKISNYDIVGELTGLIALALEGDAFAPKSLMLESLKPFTGLKNLKHFNLNTTSIRDKSYLELIKLKSLVRLDASWRMKKELRDQIKAGLPVLKSGFFMCYDFDKNEFYDGVEWWVK